MACLTVFLCISVYGGICLRSRELSDSRHSMVSPHLFQFRVIADTLGFGLICGYVDIRCAICDLQTAADGTCHGSNKQRVIFTRLTRATSSFWSATTMFLPSSA